MCGDGGIGSLSLPKWAGKYLWRGVLMALTALRTRRRQERAGGVEVRG